MKIDKVVTWSAYGGEVEQDLHDVGAQEGFFVEFDYKGKHLRICINSYGEVILDEFTNGELEGDELCNLDQFLITHRRPGNTASGDKTLVEIFKKHLEAD